MTRSQAAFGLAALAVAGGLSILALRTLSTPRHTGTGSPGASPTPAAPLAYAEARRSLEAFHFYKLLFERRAVRATRVAPDGAIELEVDPRSLARRDLARLGWPELEDALPVSARVRVARVAGAVTDTWWLSCPQACLLDVFGVPPSPGSATPLVPGRPDALVGFRLAPARLRDLALGGRSTEVLARRADLIEQLFGRPLREPFAEDLTGYGTLALYRSPRGARSLAVFGLSRTDRIRSVVDLAIGLAALTRGASVRTHRDVPVGSWSRAGGGSVAIALDGPHLIVGDDLARVEDTIDLRRDPESPEPPRREPLTASASLSGNGSFTARLVREGDLWRIDASGDSPLADNAIVRDWLSELGIRAQRGGD